jgi:chromosome segregation ATPase
LDDADPAYIRSRIRDAKALNAEYRAQRNKLTRQVEELNQKWTPDIERLDAEYADIMNRQEELQNRSQELGEITFLQRQLELLEQERDSDRFRRISVDPFIARGILKIEDSLTMLPQRILELINHHQRLRLERQSATMGREVARRRFLALREMRRRMGKELKRNCGVLEGELDEARSLVTRLSDGDED